jgi:hypothetical protein
VLGQNYCLPRYYLPAMKQFDAAGPSGGRELHSEHGVAVVISIRPMEAVSDGTNVQVGALPMLKQLFPELEAAGTWGQRVLRAVNNNTIILRTLLISGAEYVQHLHGLKDWSPDGGQRATPEEIAVADKLAGGEPLVWMVEFSIPELFPANLRKTGELILRADFRPQLPGLPMQRTRRCGVRPHSGPPARWFCSAPRHCHPTAAGESGRCGSGLRLRPLPVPALKAHGAFHRIGNCRRPESCHQLMPRPAKTSPAA